MQASPVRTKPQPQAAADPPRPAAKAQEPEFAAPRRTGRSPARRERSPGKPGDKAAGNPAAVSLSDVFVTLPM